MTYRKFKVLPTEVEVSGDQGEYISVSKAFMSPVKVKDFFPTYLKKSNQNDRLY